MNREQKNLEEFWKDLAELIDNGKPLVRSLNAVKETLEDESVQKACEKLVDSIMKGATFSSAMKEEPDVFSMGQAAFVSAGEAAGNLDVIIRKIIEGLSDGTFFGPGSTLSDQEDELRCWLLLEKLLTAGLPILQALQTVSDESSYEARQQAWSKVKEGIWRGNSMSASMNDVDGFFHPGIIDAIAEAEGRSALPEGIKRVIEAIKNNTLDSLKKDTNRSESTGEPPIIKLVSMLIYNAIEKNASDMHLEPAEKQGRLRLRIDGVMQEVDTYDMNLYKQIVSRLKIMGGLNIAEKRLPQDGAMQLKIGQEPIRLRISVVPAVFGERVTLSVYRIKVQDNWYLDRVVSSTEHLVRLKQLCQETAGLVVCSGPTGSGKTTTLYAMMKELDTEKKNVFLVEDQVDYFFDGISQVRTNMAIGLTCPAVMRSVLRQHPDALIANEIRDFDTLTCCVEAAMTNVLSMACLHADSAASALERLLDTGIQPFLLNCALSGIVNQRLVRKLCVNCRKPTELNLGILPQKVQAYATSIKNAAFHQAVGCDACNHTGYKGRIALYEILIPFQALHNAISQSADAAEFHRLAVENGMKPLVEDGLDQAALGATSVDEVIRVVANTL